MQSGIGEPVSFNSDALLISGANFSDLLLFLWEYAKLKNKKLSVIASIENNCYLKLFSKRQS